MTTAKKFFSQNVALPLDTNSDALSSIETLLHTAGYGFEIDPTTNVISTVPSMDSFLSDALTIIPAVDVYLGTDQFVRDAAAAGPPRLYKGVLVQAGVPFSVTDWMGHVVDAHETWIYSASGATTLDLLFSGV